MTDSPSLAAIDQTWTLVQDAFSAAYAAASGSDKAKVLQVREDARNAYYAALDKLFDPSNAEVTKFTSDFTTANAQMSADLDALKQVDTFLNLVASAVKTAKLLSALPV